MREPDAAGTFALVCSCCRTPIGNTSRRPGLPYVGLVADCLPAAAAERDRVFGHIHVALNTGSARRPVDATQVATFMGALRIMRKALGARLSGRYKRNPFFQAVSQDPISPPATLTAEERRAVYA